MKTFEKKMKRLEEIVEKLEDRDINLNKSLELFEEGVKLIKELEGLLNDAEGKIEQLMENLEVKEVEVEEDSGE